jgi:hypothetical protein
LRWHVEGDATGKDDLLGAPNTHALTVDVR